MFERNYSVLEKLVKEKAVIIPVSRHRKPDGSFDLEKNLQVWNRALAQLPLWEGGAPGYDPAAAPLQPQPSLAFIPGQGVGEGPRGVVLVAHGGGFRSRTGCEGFHVAYDFARRGFHTAILTYRLQPYTRYDALHDMQRAIRVLRARKAQLGLSGKVAAMGFSAGGMLCGNCATHFDQGDASAADCVEREPCRPDAVVVCYGAFAFTAFPGGLFARVATPFVRDAQEQYFMAPEANVTPGTPPCFIWQTNSDDARHAFALASALSAAGVEFELHCFPQGAHGLALADGSNDLGMDIPHVAHWAGLCAEWLEEHGI